MTFICQEERLMRMQLTILATALALTACGGPMTIKEKQQAREADLAKNFIQTKFKEGKRNVGGDACSMAVADEQDIAQTTESAKPEKTTPSESSQPPISDQAGSQQSESTNKPAIPDHLPSVFIKAVPLSSNIDIGTDFTPGIAGLIMNIAYAANSIRQATSNKFKVFYLEDGKTLFQGRTCIYRSLEIDDAEAVSIITAGDLVNVTRVSSQWNIDQVKDGEQAKKVDTSHACYERFQKLTAKSE